MRRTTAHRGGLDLTVALDNLPPLPEEVPPRVVPRQRSEAQKQTNRDWWHRNKARVNARRRAARAAAAAATVAFGIASLADAREEALRWTHPGGEPAPVRFEATVNDGARILLGFPTPDAEGVYAATIETTADPARIRAFAVDAEGTSSFPSNEIVRTASGEPPDPNPLPDYQLAVGHSCADAVPLAGHEPGSWPVIVCPPPAEALFGNEHLEKNPPIAMCGDDGLGTVTACDLTAGQVVEAMVTHHDGRQVVITATLAGTPDPDPEPLFCRGDYNDDGAVSAADVVEFAKEFGRGCPQP